MILVPSKRLILPRRNLVVPNRRKQGGFIFCNPYSFGGGVTVTWNPADKHADIVLSGGDLIAGRSGSNAYRSVRATTSRAAGKWYYEALVGGSSASSMMAGLGRSDAPLTNYVGSTSTTGFGYNANGSTYTNGTQNSSGAVSFTVGDTLMFAWDADAGSIWMGKNGTWLGSGDPAAGTNRRYGTAGSPSLFPMCSIFEGATGQTFTGRFKASAFAYSPPTGFNPWGV